MRVHARRPDRLGGGPALEVESGWTDSALVFDLLVQRGLPHKAPAAAVDDPPSGRGAGPATAMGLAGLAFVLVFGAVAARRASHRR